MFYIPKIYSQSEIEVRKSKFISYFTPFEQFKEKLDSLKKEHTKAVHFVWAYRYLNDYNQIVEDCTDDGEPKSSSGKPTLKVLQGSSIVNTAIITVRYFGGIKLGVGGLVKAYSDSANECIKHCGLIEFVQYSFETIDVTYHELSKIEYLSKKDNIEIYNKQFLNDKVVLNLKAKKDNLEKFLKNFS